ncbi:MAG: NRDE family protein [Candidatus Dormiibacterota bacterium]
MCTILLAWRCHPGTPIVLAANRDELIARPSAPPGVLSESPLILGGRDLTAGGTWLAVGAGGSVCAVTNRHPGEGAPGAPDPSRRSRGEIPVAMLTRDPDDVPSRLAGLGPGRYNPVNVLWLSAERAVAAHVDDSGPVRVVDLDPGLHVLTTRDVDDVRSAKVAMLREAMDRALTPGNDAEATMNGLRAILRDHTSASDSPADAACIHGDIYGTVSASTVIAGTDRVVYEHAPGRPCVTPFNRVPIAASAQYPTAPL